MNFWASYRKVRAFVFNNKAHSTVLRIGMGLLAGISFVSAAHSAEPPVTFPEGWNVAGEVDGDGDPTWSASPKEAIYSLVSIDVELTKSARPFNDGDFDKIPDQIRNNMRVIGKQLSGETSCDPEKRITFAGTDAVSMNCTIFGTLKVEIIALNKGNKRFTLSYWAKGADYEKYQSDWQAVLKSVRLD